MRRHKQRCTKRIRLFFVGFGGTKCTRGKVCSVAILKKKVHMSGQMKMSKLMANSEIHKPFIVQMVCVANAKLVSYHHQASSYARLIRQKRLHYNLFLLGNLDW